MDEQRTVTVKSFIGIDIALRSTLGLMANELPIKRQPSTEMEDCEALIRDVASLARQSLSYNELASKCHAILERHPHADIDLPRLVDSITLD